MLFKRSFKKAFIVIAVLALVEMSRAATYVYEDKEISKGQAIRILAQNPKAKVLKIEQVVLNEETGTLRAKKKGN